MTTALAHTDFKSDIKPVWCPGCGDFGVVNALTKALALEFGPKDGDRLASARRLLPWSATSPRFPALRSGTLASCQYGRKRATVSLRHSVSGICARASPA